MSGQRITVGLMARVVSPSVGNHNHQDHQDLDEDLHNEFGLRLNYSGDTILQILDDGAAHCFSFDTFNERSFEYFKNTVARSGILIDENTVRLFVDHWYDGCDPEHLSLSANLPTRCAR